MYLKSIEIQGFKSFANKIKFEFPEGITGIVGPNGSGKSNVADAVRWVLGEQSAKQLRGGNMQDVIFSGTELRKPLGYASVAITLDNSDHKLESSYEEITVTRRLYRSGESEYRMNGTACRLRDIHELFYDTGIGKEGYSIIGQGQIDKILSNKPEDRRELFDEAAGIVKFKRRKAATLKKLETEEANLTRVTDILQELTRQLAPLEKQSANARIYLKKKEELRLLDVNMFLLEKAVLEKDLRELTEKQSIAQSDLEQTQAEFEETRVIYDQLEEELTSLEKQIEEARSGQTCYDTLRVQSENQISLLREQIHAADANRRMYEERLAVVQEELSSRQDQQKELQQTLDQEAQTLTSIHQNSLEEEEKLRVLQQSILQSQMDLDQAKSDQITYLNEGAGARGKLQRYDAMLEQIHIRKADLNKRALVLKRDEEKQQNLLIKARDTYKKLFRESEDMKAQSAERVQEIAALQGEIEQLQQEVDHDQMMYHKEASRLESLRNLAERYDGYGNSIRRVMEQKSRVPGLIGVVADLIKTDKKYETAIETALGGSIQNIVTEDEETAKQMINYLKKNRFGRATFLPLSAVRGKGQGFKSSVFTEEGVIQTADHLVRTDDRYQGLMQYLLGRTLVVDTIEHAIILEKKNQYAFRIVTLEGELLNPGGSMTGGAFRNSSNLLGRRREIEELQKALRLSGSRLEDKKTTLESRRNVRNSYRDEVAGFNETLKEKALDLNTAQLNIRQAENKTREIQSGYSALRMESAEIEKQIRDIKEQCDAIRDRMKELNSSESGSRAEAQRLDLQLTGLREEESSQTKAVEAVHLKEAELAQARQFRQENLQRIIQELEQYTAEQQSILENQSRSTRDVTEKEQQILQEEQHLEEYKQQAANYTMHLEEARGKKEQVQSSHRAFFDKRDALSEKKSLLDKEVFRLNGMLEKAEEKMDVSVNYLWDEYEITPVQARKFVMEEVPEKSELKKQLKEVRDAIRALGSVNVDAIEEYKNVKERYEFLSTQHDDLVKAQGTLQKIILELDEGMRRQFKERFAQIQVAFNQTFRELFGGGKGELSLVEEEDVLEAGVQIISQPPGKKLQNMMQLSGGEKALTAIALLFAIQQLKPSPFCLLDEIEAALDDANVDRYAEYLHKLTEHTQFIVITHRRGTMTEADRLYGITMQEKGVSTLVSVDLIEKELDQ